ncbi:zinc finger protein 276-like [Anoplophora glabripennis]|uniref:zinc finger protein 276-like n=1 Tax=Anoplophora glabripennis TaxID=217634 RepID=UPI0008749389|nr:zinc finger protein 276-like [Anoplophora glabripennis]
MTGVQEFSCKLCLKTVIVKSFEVIENVIRDILDVLLLKLEFDDESKNVICNACRRKLYAAFEFKSSCLNTDSTIIPHVDCEKMLQLDIREVYRKEKRIESISDSQEICRLCMNLVKSEFRCIRKEELEAIQKLTPEMNINIIKDPVVCKECFDSLCTHNNFLRECLEVEEKIRGAYDNSPTESRIDTSPSDIFVKTENLGKEFNISEMEMSIKTECVDIKSEDEGGSDTPLQNLDNDPSEKSDCKDAEVDGRKNENGSENKCNAKTKRECKVLYKCNKPIYQTGCKSHFTARCARHENNSEGYRCRSCEYETENKKLLQNRQLRHKDPSKFKMYRCEDCNYEAKYKSFIKKHQVKHKDPSQVQMYGCKDCDFETKYKGNIKKHQLKHRESP